MTTYDLQKPHGLRESIASMVAEMASVCGIATAHTAAEQPVPLCNLYMGVETDLALPLSRFEAMLQASGGFARRLDRD